MPGRFVGAIIGRGGAVIKALERATGARIRCVSARGDAEGAFSLRGVPDSRARAAEGIAALIAGEEAAAARAHEALLAHLRGEGAPPKEAAAAHLERRARALEKGGEAAKLWVGHASIRAIKAALVLCHGASAANAAQLPPEREEWLAFARRWVLDGLVHWARAELDALLNALAPRALGAAHLSDVALRGRIREEAAAWLARAQGEGGGI